MIEVTSLPLRDRGFTVHFDIESYASEGMDVTYFETGQRFQTGRSSRHAVETWTAPGRGRLQEGVG